MKTASLAARLDALQARLDARRRAEAPGQMGLDFTAPAPAPGGGEKCGGSWIDPKKECHKGPGGAIPERPSEARRSKPKERISFPDPIVGPTGAKLTGYTWQWTLTEDLDHRGEPVEKRVSDWEKSIASVETGRNVVHQFDVEVNGETRTVSAESALKLMGFISDADRKAFGSIKSGARTVARLRMAQQELDQREKAWQKDWDAVEASPRPPLEVGEWEEVSAAGRSGAYRRRAWRAGDIEDYQIWNELGAFPDQDQAAHVWVQWKAKEMERRGWDYTGQRKRSMQSSIERQRDDLTKRLAKAEAKLKALTGSGSTMAADGRGDSADRIDALQARMDRRCQRPDGSYYGTSGECKKGKQAGAVAAAKKAAPRAPRTPAVKTRAKAAPATKATPAAKAAAVARAAKKAPPADPAASAAKKAASRATNGPAAPAAKTRAKATKATKAAPAVTSSPLKNIRDEAAVQRQLLTEEAKIRKLPEENIVVISPKGKVLYRGTEGDSNHVAMGKGEGLYDDFLTVTHNHPEAGNQGYDAKVKGSQLTAGFSPGDLKSAIKRYMAEMRVVGATRAYSFKPSYSKIENVGLVVDRAKTFNQEIQTAYELGRSNRMRSEMEVSEKFAQRIKEAERQWWNPVKRRKAGRLKVMRDRSAQAMAATAHFREQASALRVLRDHGWDITSRRSRDLEAAPARRADRIDALEQRLDALKRKCQTGYGCGSACISVKKECRSSPSAAISKERIRRLEQLAKGEIKPRGIGTPKPGEAAALASGLRAARSGKAGSLRDQRKAAAAAKAAATEQPERPQRTRRAPGTSRPPKDPNRKPGVKVLLRRAKPGGEYGPDGHWYPGGAWISEGSYVGAKPQGEGEAAGNAGKGKPGGGEERVIRPRRPRFPERPLQPRGEGLPQPAGLKKIATKNDEIFFGRDGFIRYPQPKGAPGLEGTLFEAAVIQRMTTEELKWATEQIRQRVEASGDQNTKDWFRDSQLNIDDDIARYGGAESFSQQDRWTARRQLSGVDADRYIAGRRFMMASRILAGINSEAGRRREERYSDPRFEDWIKPEHGEYDRWVWGLNNVFKAVRIRRGRQ